MFPRMATRVCVLGNRVLLAVPLLCLSLLLLTGFFSDQLSVTTFSLHYFTGCHQVVLNVSSISLGSRGRHYNSTPLLDPTDPVWEGIAMDTLAQTKAEIHHKSFLSFSQIGSLSAGEAFHPGFNVTERKMAALMLGEFARIAERNNLTYFMYSGTLLGSQRHHAGIPWDDDIDVCMDARQKKKIRTVLQSQLPDWIAFTDQTNQKRWKVWIRNSDTFREGVSWGFPFIDISFYLDEGDTIRDSDLVFNCFVYQKSDVFPLRRRPMWNMWLLAPRDTNRFLAKTFQHKTCVSKNFSHRNEKWAKLKEILSLPCDKLRSFYPFVVETAATQPHWSNETLMLGDQVVQWLLVEN